MSSTQQREVRDSSPEARSPERITIWEETDDLDQILDLIEETWEGNTQPSVDPSRDLGVILPNPPDHSGHEEPPPSFDESTDVINIPEQQDEDDTNQCDTSSSGDEDSGSSEPSRDSVGVIILPNTPEHNESEDEEQSPSSTAESTDLINITDQPDEDINQCNTSGNEDPEPTQDSGVMLPNTPEHSELELQDLSPPSTGESTHIINIPEQPEDNVNQCNKSAHRSRLSRFLSSVGFRGFGGGKVKDVDQSVIFTTPPQSPDVGTGLSSPEIRHSPVRICTPPGLDDSDENGETGSIVPQRPTSWKSDGVNLPSTSDKKATRNEQSNPGGVPGRGRGKNAISPSSSTSSTHWSRCTKVRSVIGLCSFGAKNDGTDMSIIFKPQTPPTPDPNKSPKTCDETNSDEKTEVPERPDSADSGVNSDNTFDEELKDQERSNPNDFTTEIPEIKSAISDKYNSHVHLHTYFKFLYAIGVSTYRVKGDGSGPRILSILQIVGFALICALAFMQALKNLKWACIDYALEQEVKVQDYVAIGLNAFHCISAIYFVKFAAFDAKNISNMLDDQTDENTNCGENENEKSKRNLRMSQSRLALSLGTTSVMMAFLATIFSRFSVNRVLAGDPLLHRSFDISYSIFVWSTKNESQSMDEVHQKYGQEFTPASISFGVIGLLMEFCGNLQNSAIRDLMLLGSLVLYQLVATFKAELERIRSATTQEMDEQLKKFKTLQRVSKNMTNALGMLLAILHMKNLFLFADFLIGFLSPLNLRARVIFDAYDLTKGFVTYMIAAKTSRINHAFRSWIHEQSDNGDPTPVGHVGSNGATMVLDRLKSEPVGLGGGMAFVTGTFIVKFLGYVSSLFLFFTEHE